MVVEFIVDVAVRVLVVIVVVDVIAYVSDREIYLVYLCLLG